MHKRFEEYLADMPIIAIIRGVKPDEILAIGEALISAGIHIIEVPLNSPQPLVSIKKLTDEYGAKSITGAGTVLSPQDVRAVANVGGDIIISPNVAPSVIEETVKQGKISLPGFATASEAFTAYEKGARHLKLFPASTYGVEHVKALKAVLPRALQIYAVGGVAIDSASAWLAAGVHGFGVGSNIYKVGDSAEAVYRQARSWVDVMKEIKAGV